MHYIIDANNLAGKLEILSEKDFDKKLIALIKNYSKNKNTYYLIFDSSDLMGDKYTEDNITIIHTPRDSFYASADDKIIEVINDLLANRKVETNLITDDLEIIAKTKTISENNQGKIFNIIKAADFAKKIIAANGFDEDGDDKNLKDDMVDKINDELLKLWS